MEESSESELQVWRHTARQKTGLKTSACIWPIQSCSENESNKSRTSYLWDSWSTFDFSTLNSRSFTLKHFLKQQTPTNIVIFLVEMRNHHSVYLTTAEEHQSVVVNLSTNSLSVRPAQGNGRCGFLANKEIMLSEVCLMSSNHFTFLNLFSSFCGPYM